MGGGAVCFVLVLFLTPDFLTNEKD
jgi:hypothetical protein